MRISVLYNTPADRFAHTDAFAEAELDTIQSAEEVALALEKKGAVVTLVPISEHTIDSVISGIDADIVFNLIEWTGPDAPFAVSTFDAMDERNILYTGATKTSYMDSCDKTRIKEMCVQNGLPTAQWQTFVTGTEPIRMDLVYPMLVKVSLEHSSVGISLDAIVSGPEQLQNAVRKRLTTYRQPIFAETLLTGREFQVTLLETARGLNILPPAEIVYAKGTTVPILTYESRWDETHSDYANSTVRLAVLDAGLGGELIDMSRKAFTHMGFRDYARFDIRCDAAGNPNFLELNSNPGLGDDLEYGMTVSYTAAGMDFADFVWEIVGSARRRRITG